MGTDPLPARLERDDATCAVAAFPDGSVDTFYGVSAGGERVDTRDAFAEAVSAESTDVFALHREAVEPGGHAVNLAAQADRLGDDATVAGHLDAPLFDELAFEAVSMGEPASVAVYGFDDGDVLAVEDSADLAGWSFEDLETAFGEPGASDDADVGGTGAADALESFLTSDVVCCVNWTSIEGMPEALASIAEVDLDGGWFVFDPSAIPGRSGADVARLFDALDALTASYDVLLTANAHEIETLSAGLGLGTDGGDVDADLRALRERADLSGVVVHGPSRAAAATPEGLLTHDNFDVTPTRHTGGGDRFDAGLVHALARGWGWHDALRLGNACASWYVATGDSGSPGELADFLRTRG